MRLLVVFIRHKYTMVLDEDCNIDRIAGCLVTLNPISPRFCEH